MPPKKATVKAPRGARLPLPGRTTQGGRLTTLGSGRHASAATKVQTAVLYSQLKKFMAKRVGILEKGPNFDDEIQPGNEEKGNILRILVGKLL